MLAQLGIGPWLSTAGCSGALAAAVAMLTVLLHDAAQPSALRARTSTWYVTPGEKQLCCSRTHASADGTVRLTMSPDVAGPVISRLSASSHEEASLRRQRTCCAVIC